MTNNRKILITGVTGKQGGAVAQALKGSGFYLRGLTRKPDSERAVALARERRCRPAVRLARQTAQIEPGARERPRNRATLLACHSGDENRSIACHG